MKVGLFGGSFNPVHHGHLNLALELKERKGLDEVWFIPSLLSPFKQEEPPLDAEHRLRMLELALEPFEEFKVCPIELQRSPPSYTIDTVKQLVAAHPQESFYLLLGADTLQGFSAWKSPLEIVRTLPLLIAARHNFDLESHLPTLKLGEEISAAIVQGLVPSRELEISGRDIRERLKKGLYCGHLIPAKVLDYIYAHQLYFNVLR